MVWPSKNLKLNGYVSNVLALESGCEAQARSAGTLAAWLAKGPVRRLSFPDQSTLRTVLRLLEQQMTKSGWLARLLGEEQLLGGRDTPEKRAVLEQVSCRSHDKQISDAIVPTARTALLRTDADVLSCPGGSACTGRQIGAFCESIACTPQRLQALCLK